MDRFRNLIASPDSQPCPERYADKYGYLRPVIRETVYKYLNCGDLKQRPPGCPGASPAPRAI